MKKRLIAIFAVLLVAAVIVILNSAVFTLQKTEVYFYGEEGVLTAAPDGFNSNGLIEDFLGRNIFFLSEKNLIASIEANEEYSDYYVVGVVRHFPDVAAVHLAKRVPVFYLKHIGENYLLDIKGYVVKTIGDSENKDKYINISNFSSGIKSIEEHTYIEFNNADAKASFEHMQKSVSTVWRLNYDYSEISLIIEGFIIEGDTLTILTKTGAKIVILKAEENFEKRLIKALGVYSNSSLPVKDAGNIIIVDEKGNVKTTTE